MTSAHAVADLVRQVRDGLARVHWTTNDLWIAAFAAGSQLTVLGLRQILSAEVAPSQFEYNLLAYALNEELDRVGSARVAKWITPEPDRQKHYLLNEPDD